MQVIIMCNDVNAPMIQIIMCVEKYSLFCFYRSVSTDILILLLIKDSTSHIKPHGTLLKK